MIRVLANSLLLAKERTHVLLKYRILISRYKIILENILALFSIRIFEYGLALVSLPYLLETLGPEYFGKLVMAQSIIYYFILLTDYGFNLTGPKEIAKTNNEHEQGNVFAAIFFGKIILFLLSIILFLGYFYLIAKNQDNFLLYSVVYMTVFGNVLFPIWFFQSIEKMKYITIVNLISRIITVVGIFIFVRNREDYIVAAFLQSITTVIAGMFSFKILYCHYRYVFIIPKLVEINKMLKKGGKIFISTLAVNIYTSSNIVILGMLSDDKTVGNFSAAQKIVACITGLIWPISQAIYPHINKLALKSKVDTLKFLKKCMAVMCGGNLILSIFLFLFAEIIIQLLLGSAYNNAVDVLRILSILPFLISLSTIFAVQVMLPFGMQNEYNRVVILAAILNTSIVIPLAYLYQGIGVAISMTLTECFVSFISWYILKQKGFKF